MSSMLEMGDENQDSSLLSFGAQAPEDSTHSKHGINAVPSYFDIHGVALQCHSRIVATALLGGG